MKSPVALLGSWLIVGFLSGGCGNPRAELERGYDVFLARCGACHGSIRDELVQPRLDRPQPRLFPDLLERVGELSDGELRALIVEPEHGQMTIESSREIPPEEVDAIVHFLREATPSDLGRVQL